MRHMNGCSAILSVRVSVYHGNNGLSYRERQEWCLVPTQQLHGILLRIYILMDTEWMWARFTELSVLVACDSDSLEIACLHLLCRTSSMYYSNLDISISVDATVVCSDFNLLRLRPVVAS
jgi:hypothetical protein